LRVKIGPQALHGILYVPGRYLAFGSGIDGFLPDLLLIGRGKRGKGADYALRGRRVTNW